MERAIPADGEVAEEGGRALDAAAVYQSHADFVWRSLSRLGVRDQDLSDALQDVFLTVHRRLHTYDGSAKLTTWLFGVCLRVASDHHRRARRHPMAHDDPPDAASDHPSPEDQTARGQARERLARVLDAMEPERRAVFVMFEVDGVACADIAELMGVPIGTVYSRLHTARSEFAQAAARFEGGGRG